MKAEPQCVGCGAKENLERVPSAATLIMGPFPGSHYFNTIPHIQRVWRCSKCEKKLATKLERMMR